MHVLVSVKRRPGAHVHICSVVLGSSCATTTLTRHAYGRPSMHEGILYPSPFFLPQGVVPPWNFTLRP
eukprot:3627125-Prorocentrum_lima.AAC.1